MGSNRSETGVRAHRRTGAALIVVLALFAGACGSGGDEKSDSPDSVGKPQAGGTLAFGLTSDSLGWLPANQIWGQSGYIVAQAVFDRLMSYDADNNVQPYLAETMEPNEDFTEWTIGLRDGVTFHNGTPLDAEALKVNLDSMSASAIWGAALRSVESVDVVDPMTVVVKMDQSYSTFPHLLTAQPGYVAAPEQIAAGDAENPIGTGPFVWDDWQQGTSISVARNDSYWRDGFPLLDGIDFTVNPDSSTQANALRAGDADMLEVNSAENFEEFEGDDEYTIYVDETGETTEVTLILNAGRPPFDDPKARAAIAYAIDRDGASSQLYLDRFAPANEGPFEESSPWNQGVEFPTYDPERAKELAEEYEAEHGEKIGFTFQIVADPNEAKVAQLLQAQLASLDIEMEISTVDPTTGIVNTATGNYDMATTTILWGSQNPDREYMVLHSSNSAPIGEIGTNITRTESDDLDEALDRARATSDPDEQVEAWADAQRALAEENTSIWIVHNDIGEIASTRVKDVQNWTFPDGAAGRPQEQTVLSLYQIWLEQ